VAPLQGHWSIVLEEKSLEFDGAILKDDLGHPKPKGLALKASMFVYLLRLEI